MVQKVVTPDNLLPADFDIGGRVANQIALRGDIFIAATVDNTAKTLTLTKIDGTTTVVSLAAFDIYVDPTATSYDATANVLTFKQTSGGPDVVINLNDLQKSAVSDGIATTASGDGTDASPLKIDVIVDPASHASLTASAAGIKLDAAVLLPVDVQDAFGTHLFQAGV